MKHARADYNRIQDPSGLIPEDEPVFLIRGQDKHGARLLRWYAAMIENDDGADPRISAMAHAHADAMDAWPVHKAPDLPGERG